MGSQVIAGRPQGAIQDTTPRLARLGSTAVSATCCTRARRNHGNTGLLGGLVSSTNVTFTFARTSRTDLAADRALAFGAVTANAMHPRVLVATTILNAAVVPPLVPYLAAPALVAALLAVVQKTTCCSRVGCCSS